MFSSKSTISSISEPTTSTTVIFLLANVFRLKNENKKKRKENNKNFFIV
jgi:hypothetical protein